MTDQIDHLDERGGHEAPESRPELLVHRAGELALHAECAANLLRKGVIRQLVAVSTERQQGGHVQKERDQIGQYT
jgi:hypothetical protein